MIPKTAHEHDFKLKIQRIRADNKWYRGTTGDKALILQACSCTKQIAVDMGSTAEMLAKYKELKNAQKPEVLTVSG